VAIAARVARASCGVRKGDQTELCEWSADDIPPCLARRRRRLLRTHETIELLLNCYKTARLRTGKMRIYEYRSNYDTSKTYIAQIMPIKLTRKHAYYYETA